MSQIIFASIEEMVSQIKPGDDRAAFLVQYRNKDYFCLSQTEVEALAAVAEELSFKVGTVPLDLVIAAARNAFMNSAAPPATAEAVAAGGVQPSSPSICLISPEELASMGKADLIKAARERGIDLSTQSKKEDFVAAIIAWNETQIGDGAMNDQPESDDPADRFA